MDDKLRESIIEQFGEPLLEYEKDGCTVLITDTESSMSIEDYFDIRGNLFRTSGNTIVIVDKNFEPGKASRHIRDHGGTQTNE